MTTAGTVAMFAGAVAIAVVAFLLQWGKGVSWAAAAGGLAGAVADTVLGATLQERRRCMGCGDYTERLVHTCGSRSRRARGIPGLNNDLVNLIASLIGSGIAYKIAELIGP